LTGLQDGIFLNQQERLRGKVWQGIRKVIFQKGKEISVYGVENGDCF